LRKLHLILNQKIDKIAGEEEFFPLLTPGDDSFAGACIVASGVALAHTWDLLEEMDLLRRVDLYQVTMPYPLHQDFAIHLRSHYQRVLVLEETYPVIELQLSQDKVRGRNDKTVPGAGELTPEVIRPLIENFLELPPAEVAPFSGGEATRPTLCAGCGHRAAFYAIRETFPEGIFPSDIGCYTLGMNLGAVDTCHCMGAGVSQAAGFYRAYAATGDEIPTIVATIGDSTFFHAGIPALINAVFHQARFILVILDNATTAMTGHQPTPELGLTAAGEPGRPVFLADLVKACGVRFLKKADPYDIPNFISLLQEADRYCRGADGGVAVVIAKHPCILDREARKSQPVLEVCVTEDCTGCRHCLDDFECPALSMAEATEQVVIDGARCIGCGVCVHVCPGGSITASSKGEK
jgi:indolepyruvate ferredoxin oxidoreductase alpha subunit